MIFMFIVFVCPVHTPHIWAKVILSQQLLLLFASYGVYAHCWQFSFSLFRNKNKNKTSKMQVFVWNSWLFFRTMPHDEFFIKTHTERVVYTQANLQTIHSYTVWHERKKLSSARKIEAERKSKPFLYVSFADFFICWYFVLSDAKRNLNRICECSMYAQIRVVLVFLLVLCKIIVFILLSGCLFVFLVSTEKKQAKR